MRSAEASRGWFQSDPVILIGGKLADITYDAPLDALLKATGPTQVVVTVPYGVQASLVLAGPGFGWGERVASTNPNGVPSAEGQAAFEANGQHAESEQQKGKKKRGKGKSSRKHKRQASGKKSMARSELLLKRDSVDVHVAVFVPAIEDMPVGVDFAPRLLRLLNPVRAEGTANSWITLTAKV